MLIVKSLNWIEKKRIVAESRRCRESSSLLFSLAQCEIARLIIDVHTEENQQKKVSLVISGHCMRSHWEGEESNMNWKKCYFLYVFRQHYFVCCIMFSHSAFLFPSDYQTINLTRTQMCIRWGWSRLLVACIVGWTSSILATERRFLQSVKMLSIWNFVLTIKF